MGLLCLISLSVLLLLDKPKFASCGSILFYMPFVSKSIKITFIPVAEEMSKRGHEVVVITQHPGKKPNPNFKEIIVDGNEFDEMTERVSKEKLKSGANADLPVMELIETALMVSNVIYYLSANNYNFTKIIFLFRIFCIIKLFIFQ